MKKEKAITLIALVITIIVLLILAGITISTLTGDNGLFARSAEVKENYSIGEAREKIILEISDLQIEKKYKLELSQLNEIKDKDIKVDTSNEEVVNIYEEGEKKYTICNVNGYQFKVYDNFEIALLGKVSTKEIDETAYIQDGIVVLYDGKNNTGNGHDTTATTWTNLAKDTLGENDGTLINVNSTEESGWTENSLILDGSDDWVKMSYLHYENMTLEIVAKPLTIKSKNQSYLANYEGGGIGIEQFSSNYIGVEAYIGGSYRFAKSTNSVNVGEIYSISAGYDGTNLYCRENSSTYTTAIEGTNTAPNSSTIFAIGTNPKGTGETLASTDARANIEVYSVRIYNRCLTEEEIQHNYQIDKQRFDI